VAEPPTPAAAGAPRARDRHGTGPAPVSTTGDPATEPARTDPPPAPGPASAPGPAPVPGRHRAADQSVHRRFRAGLLWPLAALLVVGLVAARTLRSTPLRDDGALAGPAFALLRGQFVGSPLSPEGLGAVHTAVYATVTRAFERHATLAGAERELLLVLLLVSAVLLWCTARRLGVPDAACAVGILALGAVPALAPLHAAATPAAFAVGWLLLAGWLATRAMASARPPVGVAVPAVLTAVLAVLLAPDVLFLLVAWAAAVVTARAGSGRRRIVPALTGLVLLAGVRLLVPRWDPEPSDPAGWGGDATGLLLLTAVLVVGGLLAAWRLPRFRAEGAALVVTAVLAVAPPSGRLPALLLCLPLGALLMTALVAAGAERLAGSVRHRRPRALLAAGLVAALLLAALGTAAAADLAGGPRSDLGAAADRRLVAWAQAQLPADAVLTASPRVVAELVHAGADPAQVRSGDAVPATPGPPRVAPVLHVTTGRPPDAARVIASFGALTVVDPRPVQPTPEQVAARRALAAALLANPVTEVPPVDAAVLAAGQVDPRLLSLLAGIGARFGVGLQGLPAVPGEPADALVRQAVVARIGGRALTDDPAAREQLRAWLAAQRAPYAPDRVTEVEGGLLLGYHLVRDPDALVPGSGGR
jgi:hypothetical protein